MESIAAVFFSFRFRILCFLCFLSAKPGLVLALLEGPHINTLNLLLPPRATRPVRYTLQGSGGCFTWTWDHHDIIHVQPEYNDTEGCSRSAVVTSVAPYEGRRVTAVYAKDKFTGQMIRCEVFVDKLAKIHISHHSLKLDLDGLGTLRVHAFDMEDNMFSSLVGMQFSWKLLPPDANTRTSSHVLMHVPLKNTPLSDCGCICGDIETQIELEDQGIGSDLLVVRGTNVGQERVLVNLVEPNLESLGDEIVLTVAEAISIEPPSPLYVLVDTRIQYVLKTLQYKHPAAIQLPSLHYHWFVMDSSIAEIDEFSGSLWTKNVGNTNVLVEDVRVQSHQQLSAVNVVVPSSLKLYLTPVSSMDASHETTSRWEAPTESSDTPWSIIVGWDYVVQVMAFSAQSGSTPIYITKDNALDLFFDDCSYWKSIAIPEDVQKEQNWHNGTLIKAVAEGIGRLLASLKFKESVQDAERNEMISKVEQEVLVCNPVLIIFKGGMDGKVLNLPWNRKSVQEFQLKAVGGCGSQSTDYRWLSMDTMIASINSQGLIHAKGLGSVVIRAFALTNPKNVDEIKLKTSCPSSIVKIEDFPVEAEVGSYLPVAVTMRTAEGLLYSKCDSFTSLFDWRITDGGNFIETDETINDTFKKNIHGQEVFNHICDMKQFLAVKPGRVTLTASLVIDDSCMLPGSLSHNELSVSWAISAYAPLVVVQAGDGGSHGGYNCETNHMENSGLRQFMNQCQINVLSLVPGSSMRIMLKGGPEPWGSGVEFIERHEVSTNLEEKGMDAPVVTHYAGSEGRIYEIMCRSFGNYTVTFYRGNSIAADNPHPKTEMKSLLIVCDLPSSIALLVDSESSLENIKVAAHSLHDQNHVHQSPVTVVSGRTLRVAAVALDGNSIPFANASSLSVDWMLVDCLGLAHWQGRSLSEAFIDNGRWEEFIILKEDSGQCLLKATVRMLREESWLLSAIHLQSFGSAVHGKHILTDAVQLQLVASLRVSPKSLLLYNHLNAKGLLTVIGGSSHVEAFSNDSKVALVLERSASQQFLQVAVAARGLGAALVTVRDVGLISPSEDSALVLVAEVGWVHLLISEESSIQVGSCLEIHVQAGDKAGNIFSDSQLELMDIQLNVKDEILEVLQKKGLVTHTESKVSASLIVMRGVSVGVTDIYVSVSSRTGHDVVSEMRKIEVYEPLSLHPEGLVLAPGTQSVVWVDGGPTIGVFKRFGSSNQTVVSVDGLIGMLEANFPGNTSITVQMVTQGGRVVCSAMMDVFVQVPVSMHLNIKGGQLAVGRQMSVFPVGSQEDLFSFYQLCTSYKWTVEDPQVLTLLIPKDSEETNAIDSWTSSASSHSTPKSVSAAFSTVVFGRSSGKTDIAVEFSCHFKSKGGFSSLQSYTAASAIQIVPDPPLALGMAATWLLPPNYISSSLLPQSSETMDISMHGKRSISYTLLQSCKDSARIYLDGTHIRTTEINDMACVKARDRRTGRSEIAVCVRVAEVGQVFVGPSLSSSRKFEISVGAHAVYSIVAQDEIGIAFHEVGDAVDFLAETDRSDVVSVTVLNKDADDLSRNISLHVQALKQGTAMIRLSQVGNTDIVDYLLVDVGASILPRNPVIHVGGHVNFSLSGKGLVSNENAFWWSSNPDVLLVNRQTGEGFAVAPGLSSVTYNSSHVTAYTVVKVIEISSVTLKAPKGLLTNVGVPEKGYLFAVKFSDPRGQDVGVVSNEERVSYSCHVDPAYLGSCSGWQDPDDLKTYCVFRPYSPTRLFLTLQGVEKDPGSSLVLGDFKGCTTVKILAEVTGMGETGSAMSAFAGGFEMQDVPQKIYLNPVTNKTKVTLVGSAGAVGVSWTKTEALGIKRISSEREAFGFAGHAVFEVRVIDGGEPFKSTILFHLPTTGQTEEIQVEYDVKEQNKRTLFQQVITAAIVIAVIGILPFLACARIMDLPRRQSGGHFTTDANRSYRPLSQASPGSPASPVENLYSSNFDGQQSVSLSRSPPQPYSDYVSKTIDSTPYFRREGVRRFDPTRTY